MDLLYFDPVSSLPMPHLSFLMGQLVEASDMYIMRIPSKMTCGEMHSIETAGSKSDGTDVSIKNRDQSKHVIEYWSRYDAECPIMVMYPKSQFVEYESRVGQKPLGKIRAEIDHSRIHPGYCHLRHFNGQNDILHTGSDVISDTGIAINRAFLGYRCLVWPSCASEWAIRDTKTKWPTAETKRKIEAEGCMVVWRPHAKSKNPIYEWQFLFSNAEKMLFQDELSQHQKYVYDIFKILVDYQSKHLGVKLHTVHIKSIFFTACEAISQLMFDLSPGGCFLYMTGSLLECLQEHNIPNYFVRENNMIDHLEEDDVKKLIGVIEALRLFPLQSLTFLMGSKGYRRSWLVDVISKDFGSFQTNADLNREMCQLFFPTMIRYARKLSRQEHFREAYNKVEKSRLLLIMAPPGKDGNHPVVPNLGHLLRESLETEDEYTKSMMAQIVDQLADIKLYTKDTALKKIKDYTGGVDIGGYGNLNMPTESLGYPFLESNYLNKLGVEQHNRYHNDENASKLYEAAIDHLEAAMEEEDSKGSQENSLPKAVGLKIQHQANEEMLKLFYTNLSAACRDMGKKEKLRARMAKLEELCSNHGYRNLVALIMEMWEDLGESERGIEFYATVCDAK